MKTSKFLLESVAIINEKEGKYPYVKKGIFKKVAKSKLTGYELYLTRLQAKHINNLLNAIEEIKKEIESIIYSKNYDYYFYKEQSKVKPKKSAPKKVAPKKIAKKVKRAKSDKKHKR
jgi:hypothetical protein